MKVCSIFNEYDKQKCPVAYLIYYEKYECFYIEINKDADFENLPMLLALFVEKGIYSIDSYWSKKWVCSRIIPTDRQNLGQLLKANSMKYYDEYKLLIKGKGKCSHDDFCVEEISFNQIDNTILQKRWMKNIKDILIDDEGIIVFYNDDITRKYRISQLADRKEHQNYIKKHLDEYEIMPGGYEINWNDIVYIHVEKLRTIGDLINISLKYFEQFAKRNLINTAEACEILDCSRQNVEDLVKRNKLKPVQTSAKNKMFLKADINKKLW